MESSLLASWMNQEKCPYKRALLAENMLQSILGIVREYLDETDYLPLGLDDYLAALANAHETNIYLLQQRIRGSHHEKMASRVAQRHMERRCTAE